MVGNKGQGRPDVGGVVAEQESADAGQYDQVPVKACGDTRVELLENAPPGWLRSPGFRYHPAPPRVRLNAAAGQPRDQRRRRQWVTGELWRGPACLSRHS